MNLLPTFFVEHFLRNKFTTIGFAGATVVMRCETATEARHLNSRNRPGEDAAVAFIFIFQVFFSCFLDITGFVSISEVSRSSARIGRRHWPNDKCSDDYHMAPGRSIGVRLDRLVILPLLLPLLHHHQRDSCSVGVSAVPRHEKQTAGRDCRHVWGRGPSHAQPGSFALQEQCRNCGVF